MRIVVSTHVDRPPQDVFGYLADFENNPEWQKGMQECTFTSEPPSRVGSTYDQVAKFRRKEIRSSFVVTGLEPGRSISIETTVSPFPIRVTRTVTPAAGGSAVQAVVEGDASGFMRLAGPLLTAMVRRSVKADYRRLKELLESR